MSSTTPNLVDEVEASFQNCISLLTSQEHFNVPVDPEEIKNSMEQSIHRFLESTRHLDCFFMQKRLQVSAARPELTGKEDIAELRAELERKNHLIQRHNERLQQWQAMLNCSPSAPVMGGSPTPPAVTASNTAAMQQAAMGIPQPGPPQPVAAAPAGIPTMQGISQGPLAFLEQTTSNIGNLPRGMGGS